jgi:hypothetical protein
MGDGIVVRAPPSKPSAARDNEMRTQELAFLLHQFAAVDAGAFCSHVPACHTP